METSPRRTRNPRDLAALARAPNGGRERVGKVVRVWFRQVNLAEIPSQRLRLGSIYDRLRIPILRVARAAPSWSSG